MGKEQIYEQIVDWENENGEDFIDSFNSNIHSVTFMAWCLGKGYIDSKKFDLWAEAYNNDKLEADDPNYYIYDSDGEVEFAVIISEEWNDDSQKKAHELIAEFISEIETYSKRLNDFINDNE